MPSRGCRRTYAAAIVVFFHVDNLGFGELGCYGGGVLRSADARRIDEFARESLLLLNYAP